MIKLKSLLKEASEKVHEYGCVMLYFTFPEINTIHHLIDQNDIYTDDNDPSYGLEDEPHITLLYGLHPEVTVDQVKHVLDGHVYSTCNIFNASVFNNEKFDVLKFDVKGEGLNDTNTALKKYPYTSNFPNYHPHLTIGYLKKGTAQKYADKINKMMPKGYQLVPKYAVYSESEGTKNQLPIHTDLNESNRWIELSFIEDTKSFTSKKKITEYYSKANQSLFEHLNPVLSYNYSEKLMGEVQKMWVVDKQDQDPQFVITLKTKPDLKYWILDFYFVETGFNSQSGLTGKNYLDTLTKVIKDNVIPYFISQTNKDILFFNAYSGDNKGQSRKLAFKKIIDKFVNTEDLDIQIKGDDFIIKKK